MSLAYPKHQGYLKRDVSHPNQQSQPPLALLPWMTYRSFSGLLDRLRFGAIPASHNICKIRTNMYFPPPVAGIALAVAAEMRGPARSESESDEDSQGSTLINLNCQPLQCKTGQEYMILLIEG